MILWLADVAPLALLAEDARPLTIAFLIALVLNVFGSIFLP